MDLRNLEKQARDNAKTMQNLPNNYGGTIKYFMKRDGLTNESLSERALMSPTTISRHINNSGDYKFEAVLRIAIGLELNLVEASYLLERAGFKLTNTYEHEFIKLLLNEKEKLTINGWNDAFKKAHIDLHLKDTFFTK